jgi:hypothetical protein
MEHYCIIKMIDNNNKKGIGFSVIECLRLIVMVCTL